MHRTSVKQALHKLSSALQSICKMLRLVLSQETLQRLCELPVTNTMSLGPKGFCGGHLGLPRCVSRSGSQQNLPSPWSAYQEVSMLLWSCKAARQLNITAICSCYLESLLALGALLAFSRVPRRYEMLLSKLNILTLFCFVLFCRYHELKMKLHGSNSLPHQPGLLLKM